MGGTCSRNGKRRGAYRVLVGKTERRIGRKRSRLEENIKNESYGSGILDMDGLTWLKIRLGGGIL
jgi:hypothetical protein